MLSLIASRRALAASRPSVILRRTIFANQPAQLPARAKVVDDAVPKPKAKPAKKAPSPTKSKTPAPKSSKGKKEGQVKVKKESKKKEPVLLFTPLPKRPAGAFVAWAAQREDTPGTSPTERGQIASLRWQDLPPFEKQALEEKFAREYAEYKERLAEWEAQQTPEGLKQFRSMKRKVYQKGKAKREAVAGQRPKQPQTPFFRFLSDYRKDPKNLEGAPDANGKEVSVWIAAKAGAEWKTMDESARAPWATPAKKEREAWREAIAQWRLSLKA
ncbi:hypothetical protein BOTBODRAFT_30545 [Botryobasidium botryosum FD-172 SS1]|uniref:HMG box domain-containing protein n=1 Tax=Botryobasidium botryosum (strain FD-172 SS1) TaxID=930990 RepID=A0A067MXJ5_BOTB1|nr:hypothetical protein BOTBODRAFT_30545 [Botryobasidium botryosum FD-172 SS1]